MNYRIFIFVWKHLKVSHFVNHKQKYQLKPSDTCNYNAKGIPGCIGIIRWLINGCLIT